MFKYIGADKKFKLDESNYYSKEAMSRYMSIHTFTNWLKVGNLGMYHHCEAELMDSIEHPQETSNAMLIGSYLDAYYEGNLDKFLATSGMTKKDGTLLATYSICPQMVEKCKASKKFTEYMTGDKQKIFTGTFAGIDWKIKTDNLVKNSKGEYVKLVDLKTCSDIHDKVNGLNFIQSWGYDFQLALYQEILAQNIGKYVNCYICAVAKDNLETKVIYIPNEDLQKCRDVIQENAPRFLELIKGKREPERCEECDYCKSTSNGEDVINYLNL